MKVFSKERFIELNGMDGNYGYEAHRCWVDELDGKTQEEIRIMGYIVIEPCMVEKGEKHDVTE